jgi:hypothetical protein
MARMESMIVRYVCGAALCATACAVLRSTPVQAQQSPADHGAAPAQAASCPVLLESGGFTTPAADLARMLSLQDSTARTSFVLRRAGRAIPADACVAPLAIEKLARAVATAAPAQRLAIVPAELLVVGHSAYPRDWNDGALWGGRGINTSLTAGVRLRLGPLTTAIAPVLGWHSNSAYDLPGADSATILRHPWWADLLDAPQRHGFSSFAALDPGQSYVRLDVGAWSAGFSTENMAWGPARRNPLLLSGSAPGFGHAFIETGRPVDAFVADIEFQLFWGRLTESEYFDANPDNDHRVLAGLLLAIQPHVLPGLTIGGARTQSFTWWPGLELSEVILRPYRGVRSNPQGQQGGDNQLIGLFFRWNGAPYGLEVYGEWAREDHWGEWTELLRNLDSSQAYTLGLQKLFVRGNDAVRIAAEITHLSDALPVFFASRGVIPFYSNTSVPQGHTHRGQMLGAPIGTGAESQWLGADYLWNRGRTSFSIERARYEDDAYHLLYAPRFGAHARDSELSVRLGHMTTFGTLSIDAELGWSRRYNRGFIGLDTLEVGEPYRRDGNLGIRLGARWTPLPGGR